MGRGGHRQGRKWEATGTKMKEGWVEWKSLEKEGSVRGMGRDGTRRAGRVDKNSGIMHHNNNHLTASFPGNLGKPVPER